MLTIEERNAVLQEEIEKYVDQGWRVTSQTQTTAQLTRDKHASCCLAVLLAILFVLPAVLYLLLYKGTENLYLVVNEEGQVVQHG